MMKKFIGMGLVLILALSCNDKLWDELDRVELINEAQAAALRELREANQDLQDELNQTEYQLDSLISLNTDAIHNVSQELDTAILDTQESLDSLSLDIESNYENIVALEADLIDGLEVQDSLISNLQIDLTLLEEEVETIEPVVYLTEVTHTHVTNQISQTIVQDDLDDFSELQEFVDNVEVYWNNDGCVHYLEFGSDIEAPDGLTVRIEYNNVHLSNGEFRRAPDCSDEYYLVFGTQADFRITYSLNGRTITEDYNIQFTEAANGDKKKVRKIVIV